MSYSAARGHYREANLQPQSDRLLVAEVADAGKHHREAALIGSRYDIRIAH